MGLLQLLRSPEGRYPVLFSLKPKLLSLVDCPLSVTSHLVLGKSNVLRPLPHISRPGIITLGDSQGHVGEGNNAVWSLGLKRSTWSMDALGGRPVIGSMGAAQRMTGLQTGRKPCALLRALKTLGLDT